MADFPLGVRGARVFVCRARQFRGKKRRLASVGAGFGAAFAIDSRRRLAVCDLPSASGRPVRQSREYCHGDAWAWAFCTRFGRRSHWLRDDRQRRTGTEGPCSNVKLGLPAKLRLCNETGKPDEGPRQPLNSVALRSLVFSARQEATAYGPSDHIVSAASFLPLSMKLVRPSSET